MIAVMYRIFGSLLVVLIACDPFEPVQGTEGAACYPNGTCNDGLVCLSDLCVYLADAGPIDAVPIGVPDAAQPDAAPQPFICNDDGAIDDNNTLPTATLTPIPDIRNDYELVGLSICPDFDVDIFQFRADVTAPTVRVDIRYRPEYGDLLVELLDSGGLSVASGVITGPYPSDPELVQQQILLNDVPADTYYALVRAPPGVENNYSIFMQVTEP